MKLLDFFGARAPRAGRRRSYKAARTSRLEGDWIPIGGTDANAEVAGGLASLRDRSSDGQRNDRWVNKAISELTSYLAGGRPQSAIRVGRGISEAQAGAWNAETDDAFARWADECQVDGDLSFGGVATLAIRGMVERGESLTRLRPRRLSDGLTVPLQLEVLEGDYLTADSEELTGGRRIVQGIELDAIGRRVAYHLHRRHPSDGSAYLAGGTSRVAAARICHLYAATDVRPGQLRGVPWLHAILSDARNLAGFQEALRVLMRASSSYMAVVETPGEADFYDDADAGEETLRRGINAVRDSDGLPVEQIEAGLFIYAEGGKTVKFNAPPKADGIKDFLSTELHGLAAGAGLPYELLTGDLSQTNYSSIMFGMGAYKHKIELLRDEVLRPLWFGRVWRAFVAAGILAGVLPAAAGPVAWTFRPLPVVDPLAQAKADLLEVRGGWKSLRRKILEKGEDPDRVLAEVAKTQAELDALGVVVDGDPSKITLAGQLQVDPWIGKDKV